MNSHNFKPGRKLSFQLLETRALMAGNVAVSVQNHSLVVTGDNKDNGIEIVQIGNGHYRVSSMSGNTCTINGKSTPQIFFGVTGDLKINLRGGNDALDIHNDYNNLQRVLLPRNLQVNLGSGEDDFHMTEADVLGGVSITGDSGDKNLYVAESHIGSPNVNSGNNDFTIDLDNGNSKVVTRYTSVERDLTIKMGGNSTNSDLVDLYGGPVGRNLSIETGSGNDFVVIGQYSVQKKLQIQTGDGRDVVALSEEALNDNIDQFQTVSSTYHLYADEVFVDLGKGDDDLHLCNVDARQATYLGGSGTDKAYHDQPDFGSESISGFEIFPAKLDHATINPSVLDHILTPL